MITVVCIVYYSSLCMFRHISSYKTYYFSLLCKIMYMYIYWHYLWSLSYINHVFRVLILGCSSLLASLYTRVTFMKNVRELKLRKSNTKFPLKRGYFLGIRGLKVSSYITIPLVDVQTYRVYMYCICSICTFCTTYLFIYNAIWL